MAGNPGNVSKEVINEVILRLLKLNAGTELDYQTYAQKIKVKLASARLVGKFIPAEEDELLRNEFKRVRNKEGRFVILRVKKTKVSSPPPPPSGGTTGGGGGAPPKTGAIQKAPPAGKITADKFFYQNFVQPVNVRDVTEKVSAVSKGSDPLVRISNLLDSIIQTLTEINNFDKEQAGKQRVSSENKRRAQREKDLESKSFEGIKKALSVITKPFQSIWDKIVNFITNVILGRIVIKLIDWIGDPKNQQKIQSIIRFLGDHWPTLLALYLRFGTGIGKFVGTLTRILVKGAFKLVKLTAQLAARAGLKGAGRFAKFLGGGKGRAIATGVGIAADVAITAGTAFGLGKLFGGDNKDQQQTPPTQGFSGGGFVRIPKFAGGGLANFNKIFGNASMGASLGAMFGPMGMLAGAGIGAAASSGVVKGQKGTDKVPAMLTDGEFVMSVGAVKKYGLDTLEAMNAAGGGTNIPKISNNIVYAAGGGFVGDAIKAQDAWSNYMKSNPQKFAKGAEYGDFESVNKASRDFMRTFMKTGQPPEWAKVVQKTTRVDTPGQETYSQRPPKSSQQPPRSSQQPPRSSQKPPSSPPPPPKSSSTSIMRRSTSALSTDVRTPMQSIRTNMKVPGGFGNLKSLGVEMLADYLMERGFDKINAMIVANKINEGKKLTGIGRENYIEQLRNVVQREERWQRGIGGLYDSIIGMGRKSRSQKMSESSRAILEGLGSGAYQGGGIKGGWGLKKQEFKDMPRTQIMTDDKGRPFVGYKAMRGGKPVYVRGPQPGSGTTNPLEMLGRMINPNAYKENDARIQRGKHREAMVNALENMQAQGMAPDAQARMMKQMGGNLKDTQNDLNYRKKTKAKIASGELKPDGRKRTGQEQMRMKISKSQKKKAPPKPNPRKKANVSVYRPAGGGMGGRRGSGARPSTPSKAPSFSANHKKGTSTAQSVLGIKK
jgi:hypothetical protein